MGNSISFGLKHPLVFFLTFDWMTDLYCPEVRDGTSKGHLQEQSFVFCGLHVTCRARENTTWTMPGKGKFCDHCGEFVSERTYRRHSNLKLVNQRSSSDEDASLVHEENEVVLDLREEQDDERHEHEVPGTRIKSAFMKSNNRCLYRLPH